MKREEDGRWSLEEFQQLRDLSEENSGKEGWEEELGNQPGADITMDGKLGHKLILSTQKHCDVFARFKNKSVQPQISSVGVEAAFSGQRSELE